VLAPADSTTRARPWIVASPCSENTKGWSAGRRVTSRARVVASYKRGKADDSQGVYIGGAILEPGTLLPIPAEERKHLRARRATPGSVVRVLDGIGGAARAELDENLAYAIVLETVPVSAPASVQKVPFLSICFSAPKSSSRADWAVEKLTEVGAGELLLVQTERSEGHGPPSQAKHERWSRLLIAAVKQSLRTSFPQVRFIGGIDDLILLIPMYGVALLLSPDGIPILSVLEEDHASSPSSILLIAGPEGGLTKDEEKRLECAGCVLACLGKQRLRVETAVVAACCAVGLFYDAKA
jgi:16S rRNA (uracil1498-N3)-methyltransferase